MWAIIRLVVVLPLVPVTATTGIRGVMVVGPSPVRRVGDPLGGPADRLVDVGGRQLVEHRGHRAAHLLGSLAVPPGVGDDELVRVVGRPHAYREPAGARLVRHRPDQPRHRAGREPLPEPAPRLPRPRAPQPDPGREPGRLLGRHLRQPGDVQGQLDRRAGEVEVGPFEDPELDQGRHVGNASGPGRSGCCGWAVSGGRFGRRRGDSWSVLSTRSDPAPPPPGGNHVRNPREQVAPLLAELRRRSVVPLCHQRVVHLQDQPARAVELLLGDLDVRNRRAAQRGVPVDVLDVLARSTWWCAPSYSTTTPHAVDEVSDPGCVVGGHGAGVDSGAGRPAK